MRQYFLGIGFEKKTQEFLNELKQSNSGQRPLSAPAHITLISPFFAQNEKMMVAGFKKWALKQEKFDLKLKGVGVFKQKKYATIFLFPEKSETVKKLYNALKDDFDWLPKMNNFVAHLTIAHKVPFEMMQKVKEGLRAKNLQVESRVEGIWIYIKEEEEGGWKEWEWLSFG